MLLTNIKGLVQVRTATPGFLAGSAMAHVPVIENAFLKITNGIIEDFGPMGENKHSDAETIDASDRFVLPGYVDSHTHLVFAASREEEFVLKIKGATYAEIAAKGGGILNSARKLQQLSEEELFERSMPRVHEIIRSGTCAVEIKSGYGLTVKDEVKMLRVARKIGKVTPLAVRTTFLGAHAVPANRSKEDYIQEIIEEMLPAIAAEKLADYIDVFCETGFFSPEETEKLCEAGKKAGLKPRIHANQLNRSGGVQVGVKVGAVSVDHLENMGDEEIEVLKGTSVMPTALPGAAFFLNLPFPPARKIIDSGLPLAIASDFNPGSAPSGDMNMMMALSCIKMKLTPEEAINACTINTAASLDLLSSHGSITRGKIGSVVVTKKIPSLAYLPYRFGANLLEFVILNGKLID